MNSFGIEGEFQVATEEQVKFLTAAGQLGERIVAHGTLTMGMATWDAIGSFVVQVINAAYHYPEWVVGVVSLFPLTEDQTRDFVRRMAIQGSTPPPRKAVDGTFDEEAERGRMQASPFTAEEVAARTGHARVQEGI